MLNINYINKINITKHKLIFLLIFLQSPGDHSELPLSIQRGSRRWIYRRMSLPIYRLKKMKLFTQSLSHLLIAYVFINYFTQQPLAVLFFFHWAFFAAFHVASLFVSIHHSLLLINSHLGSRLKLQFLARLHSLQLTVHCSSSSLFLQ